ncbi:MAG: hypothetical protein KGJ86_20425, partial [Chloroflexota bacterium]|nr:hypothetical protein [Chloroflexota bacterium]
MIATPTTPPSAASPGPAAFGTAGARSPDLSVPLRYMLAGVAFMVLAYAGALAFAPAFLGFYFTPKLLVVTHLAALGWFTMVAMGAIFQLSTVALEVAIHSQRLARLQFWLYLAGVVGLIVQMGWGSALNLAISAGLVVAAVSLFLYNMARTLSAARNWPLTGWFMAAALVYLGLLVLAGFVLALNLVLGFLPVGQLAFIRAHAHLGLLGWLSMLIIGVSYKLTPMFVLSHPFDEWRLGKPIFVLLQVVVVGLFASLLLSLPRAVLAIFALLGVVAAGLFASDYVQMLRVRRRRPIDLTVKHNLTAVSAFVAAAGLGFAVPFVPPGSLHDRLILAYAYLGFGGWIGFSVVGQLYKVVPFLVWTQRYASRVGREQVPLLRQMYPVRLAEAGFGLLVAALLLTPAAIAVGWLPGIQIGLALGLAGAGTSAINL